MTCLAFIQKAANENYPRNDSKIVIFLFASRSRHTRLVSDWSSDVCSSDLSQHLRPVGAVAIDKGARGMDRVADRFHVGLEQAAGVGIGDHHRGDIEPEPRFQRFEVDRKSVV